MTAIFAQKRNSSFGSIFLTESFRTHAFHWFCLHCLFRCWRFDVTSRLHCGNIEKLNIEATSKRCRFGIRQSREGYPTERIEKQKHLGRLYVQVFINLFISRQWMLLFFCRWCNKSSKNDYRSEKSRKYLVEKCCGLRFTRQISSFVHRIKCRINIRTKYFTQVQRRPSM